MGLEQGKMISFGGTDRTTQDNPFIENQNGSAGKGIGFRDKVPESILTVVKTESMRFPETTPLDSEETPHSLDRNS